MAKIIFGAFLILAIAVGLYFYSLGYRIDIILVYPITPQDLTPQGTIG
jgi:hypothetical protein